MSDKAFADYTLDSGATVHNSEHNADGSFRRMIVTPQGVHFDLPNGFTIEQAGLVAALVDQVADSNYAVGRRDAQKAIRDALGIEGRR